MIESQLTDRCKKHDSEAQRVVYERLAPQMLGVCLRYAGNQSDAEDMLQDGFITAFQKIKQFKNKGSFEGWIRKIMVNTALMYLRDKKQTRGAVPFEEVEWQIADDDHEEAYSQTAVQIVQKASFTQEEILEQVALLPDGFREIFNLYAIENMKHKDIAKTLDISVGTSKSQLSRARKQIQKGLYYKALDQNKQKENKRKRIVAIITGMGLGFEHIDVLAQEALTGLSVPTTAGWEAVQQSLDAPPANTVVSSAAITKVAVSIATAGAIAAGVYFIVDKSDTDKINTHKEVTSPAQQNAKPANTFVIPADSCAREETTATENSIIKTTTPVNNPAPEEAKNTQKIPVKTDTVQIPVKKVIRVQRKTIVRDTIHKRDTVYIH